MRARARREGVGAVGAGERGGRIRTVFPGCAAGPLHTTIRNSLGRALMRPEVAAVELEEPICVRYLGWAE